MSETCYRCGGELRRGPGSGYGTDADGRQCCYPCCAMQDREAMRQDGRVVLYLHGGEVANWPGSLRFPCLASEGCHNIAGTQTVAYFWFEGEPWIGRQYGRYSELCYCRRLKHPAGPHRRLFVEENPRYFQKGAA